MHNWKIFKYVLLLFLGWRIGLIIVTFLGVSLIPNADPLNQRYFLPHPSFDYFRAWANWDGGHFLGISEHGYSFQQTPFFPLYPILISLLHQIGIPSLWSGLLISNISLVVTLFFLFKLCKEEFNEEVAKKAVFAILIFPTSFYLGAVYTESLFLALSVSAFYFIYKNHPYLAFCLAGLSFAERIVGVATIAAITAQYLLPEKLEYKINPKFKYYFKKIFLYCIALILILKTLAILTFYSKEWLLNGILSSTNKVVLIFFVLISSLFIFITLITNLRYKNLFSIKLPIFLLISLIPFSIYLIYQYYQFNEPLGLLVNHQHWGKQPTWPWVTVLSSFETVKQLSNPQVGVAPWAIIQFMFEIVFIIGTFYAFLKLRFSYFIFCLIALLMPISSGSLISIQRNGVILFPIFIIFALIKNELVEKTGVFVCLLLLALFSILFVNSYWIV